MKIMIKFKWNVIALKQYASEMERKSGFKIPVQFEELEFSNISPSLALAGGKFERLKLARYCSISSDTTSDCFSFPWSVTV